MEDVMHLVEFDKYCDSCEHKDTKCTEDPCDECLGSPARQYLKQPINYKKRRIKH